MAFSRSRARVEYTPAQGVHCELELFRTLAVRDGGDARHNAMRRRCSIATYHVNMIALGSFARYTFDHRQATFGKDLQISSDKVNWEYLRMMFEKATGWCVEVISVVRWMGEDQGQRRHKG
ncbi:hypothetical protein DAEQUDRAFT_364867 [Daedalea quercina L-15889]|uniref:Uncharacterized protein n=1 Tax=Daedalea quercina L-15889 TaxID=1314783 RepID=A0A165P8W8_9APHY|nr:hypothetical protein DAEQUDRAFT_364867 [Daedalea quercina L-15889]